MSVTDTSVLVTDSGGVRTLTLNRPQRRNAMNVSMVEDLEDRKSVV